MVSLEYIVMFTAWLVGGFINGVTGVGIAIIALPIMAISVEIKVAIAASSILVCFVSAYMTIIRWRFGNKETAGMMIAGSIPGIVAGVAVLYILSDIVLQFAIGLFLLLYVAWQMFPNNAVCTNSKKNSLIAGFLSGFCGASTSFSGPPIASYMLLLKWEKYLACGTMSLFFFPMTFIACIAQAVAGFYNDPAVWQATLVGVPGTVVGMVIGSRMMDKFSPEFFKAALLLLIAFAGVACLYFSFRQLS